MNQESQYNFVKKWSYIDVAFWSIMVGAGESFVGPYVLELGFSERYSGLLATVPLALASILQLSAFKIVQNIHSRRKHVFLCAFFQAICLLALIGWGLFTNRSKELLVGIFVAYWFFGLSAGPEWNAWIVSLVPFKKRNEFFAQRGKLSQSLLILTLTFASFLLYYTPDKIVAFQILFFLASIARLASSFALFKHPEESGSIEYTCPLKMSEFKAWIFKKDVLGILFVVAFFHFGVHIGAPFFTAYFLKKINYSYASYMLALSIPFLTRALMYGYNDRIVEKFGIKKPLVLAVIVIGVCPLVWIFYPSLWFLLPSQFAGGWAWAIFEYCILLTQIQDFPQLERLRVLTWTNFFVGITTLLGVVLGSEILGKMPSVLDYHKAFYLSVVFRLTPLAFIFLIDWKSTRSGVMRIYMRTIGIRFNKGVVSKPILYIDQSDKRD